MMRATMLVLAALTACCSAENTQHRFSGPVPTTLPPSSAAPTTTSTASTGTNNSSTAPLVVDEGGGRFEYIQVISSSSAPAETSTPGASRAMDMEPAMKAGLQFLSNIYEPHRWSALPAGLGLSPGCRAQLRTYLTALDNGTSWAVQMTDASGRYSSQFFFGNDFWMGSHTLCEELGTRYAIANPPWPVVFHVLQIKVHLDPLLTPLPRVLHLGVCLPRSCDPKDITVLLQAASSPPKGPKDSPPPSMEVVRTRRVPGPYSILADTKLHILAGVAAAVLIMMVAGAVLEELTQRASRASDTGTTDSEQPGQHQLHQLHQRSAKGAPPPAQKPGIMVQIVMAFSPLSNGAKILNCQVPEDDSLTAVHGLRFLSLAWVILVHTYLQVFAIAENKTLRTVTERNFLFQTVSNATFSVDTFFFISGLLVAFLYFKATVKGSKKPDQGKAATHEDEDSKKAKFSSKKALTKFFVLLGYRFIRLIPTYLFALGMVELSMRWIHNNSVFEPKILDHLNCDRYWWRNALFINSLFPRKDMCMLWSWYMANDVQFYVIGILLMLFSARYFRLVAAALVTLLVSSWVTTAAVSVHYEYRARIEEPFAKFDELYDKPWTRLGPYLIGMITGWVLFKIKDRLRMSLPAVLVGWTLSLLCLASLVYGLLHQKLGLAASAAYVSLGHSAWSIALGWIVIACSTGHGGYINTLLSFRALQPLSRLTYCAYLLHPMIQVLTSYQMDGPLHLHNALVLTLYFGNVVASYLLAFVVSLAFEAPIVRLLKIGMPARLQSD